MIRTRSRVFTFIVLSLALAAVMTPWLSAQALTEPPMPFEMIQSQSGVVPGGEITFAGVFDVPADHHITSRDFGLFYLEFDVPEGFTAQDTLWPVGPVEDGNEVYRDRVAILHTYKVAGDVKPGDYTIPYSYSFQICRDIEPTTCFMPNGGEGEITVKVLPPGSTPLPSSDPVFAGLQPEREPASQAVSSGGGNLEDRLTASLESGSMLAFLLVFLAGILVSFTPCVYPMIPIIIGFVGSSAGGSRAKGFTLSVFFVLGLAIMYAVLGVIAGATGALFGALMANPIVLWVIVAVFIALGVSMLGAFNIALPASLQGKLMSNQRQGIIGAVIMGGITGIVAAPCAGPPLLVLLGWIGKTGNLVLGFFLMAVFALGIGVLFIVIGTFAGAMTALPQAGPWMDKIKKGLGILIFAVALYYIGLLVPHAIFMFVLGAFILLVGLFFGAFAAWENLSTAGKYWKGIGLILVLTGSFYLLFGLAERHELPLVTGQGIAAGGVETSAEGAAEEHVPWRVNEYEQVLAEAAQTGKPVLIDFYADWCAVCVELEHKVWNQPEVIAAAESYIPLKLDFTRSDRELEALRKKYNVGGLPTVLILGPKGNERSRFSSFMPPGDVAGWLEENK